MLIDRLYSGINETKQRELELLVSCLHKSQLITDNLQYNGIKITKQCSDVNCVKSIRILGWSGPYYATVWVNTGTYSVRLHIQSKCGKKFAPEKSSELKKYFPHSGLVL